MKLKIKLLIGIALVLMLCISPVVALSGDDFIIVVDESGDIDTYKYLNVNDLSENYIKIRIYGTIWLRSIVTFEPANIPDAPVEVVDTTNKIWNIYLSRSVDKWEIKYYSRFLISPGLDDNYLKNAGVVNLKVFFGKYSWTDLRLDLSFGQFIWCPIGGTHSPTYYIPDVD